MPGSPSSLESSSSSGTTDAFSVTVKLGRAAANLEGVAICKSCPDPLPVTAEEDKGEDDEDEEKAF